MTEDRYLNQSIQRAIQVLEIFQNEKDELGLSEISRRMGLPKSNVFRIVYTLESEGYLEKNPQNNKYHLGIKVLFLCDSILSKIPYRGRAYPILRELAKITDETVVLVLYSDSKAICIEKIESTNTVKMSCSLGQTFDLHRGSTGLSLLMGMPPEMMRDIICNSEPLHPLSDKTITDPKAIIDLIEENRPNGYISSTGMVDPGVSAISMPVSCPYKNIYMGISVLGPEYRFTEEKKQIIIENLKKCAKEMTAIITLNS